MDKQIVGYLYNGTALGSKKDWTTDTYNNVDNYHRYYADRKKPDTESRYFMIQFICSSIIGKN